MKCLTCGFFAFDTDITNCPLCQSTAQTALWQGKQTAKPLSYSLLSAFTWLGAFILTFRSE